MNPKQEKSTDTTHFGFETVKTAEKVDRVGKVFSSVASKYDIMNDFMSFGLHRFWKRFALQHTGLKPGNSVLDLAGGTGDITKLLAKQVGPSGQVILSDINANMLQEGRDRLTNQNYVGNIQYAQINAEQLPFSDNSFHAVTISFGLRNVTNKSAALQAIFRVLKPGGKLIILEFSQPKNPLLKQIYDKYSFSVIPKIGKFIAQDEASYQYLVESIRMHPDQTAMCDLLNNAGFHQVKYYDLAGGIVALHLGEKI